MRPESLVISADASAALRFEVSLVEELGADAYLYGQLADENADEKLFTLRSDGRVPPLIGETVRLDVRTDAVHVFHPTTGDRLP